MPALLCQLLQAVINHNNNHNEDDLGLSPLGPSPWEQNTPGCLLGLAPGPLPGMCPCLPQAHGYQVATTPLPGPTLQFQTSTDPSSQEKATRVVGKRWELGSLLSQQQYPTPPHPTPNGLIMSENVNWPCLGPSFG